MSPNAVPHAVRPEKQNAAAQAVAVMAAAAAAPAVDARCIPLYVPNVARTPRFPLNHAPAKLYIAATATARSDGNFTV